MVLLENMINQVLKGAKRIDGNIEISGRHYEAKCYWAGMIIRLDLSPKENLVQQEKERL